MALFELTQEGESVRVAAEISAEDLAARRRSREATGGAAAPAVPVPARTRRTT